MRQVLERGQYLEKKEKKTFIDFLMKDDASLEDGYKSK